MKKQQGWSLFSSSELKDLYSAWEHGDDQVWHREFHRHGIDPQDYDNAILTADLDYEDVYRSLSFVNSVGDEVLIENAAVDDEIRDYVDLDFLARTLEGAWRE